MPYPGGGQMIVLPPEYYGLYGAGQSIGDIGQALQQKKDRDLAKLALEYKTVHELYGAQAADAWLQSHPEFAGRPPEGAAPVPSEAEQKSRALASATPAQQQRAFGIESPDVLAARDVIARVQAQYALPDAAAALKKIEADTGLTTAQTGTEKERPALVRAETKLTGAQTTTEQGKPAVQASEIKVNEAQAGRLGAEKQVLEGKAGATGQNDVAVQEALKAMGKTWGENLGDPVLLAKALHNPEQMTSQESEAFSLTLNRIIAQAKNKPETLTQLTTLMKNQVPLNSDVAATMLAKGLNELGLGKQYRAVQKSTWGGLGSKWTVEELPQAAPTGAPGAAPATDPLAAQVARIGEVIKSGTATVESMKQDVAGMQDGPQKQFLVQALTAYEQQNAKGTGAAPAAAEKKPSKAPAEKPTTFGTLASQKERETREKATAEKERRTKRIRELEQALRAPENYTADTLSRFKRELAQLRGNVR